MVKERGFFWCVCVFCFLFFNEGEGKQQPACLGQPEKTSPVSHLGTHVLGARAQGALVLNPTQPRAAQTPAFLCESALC